MTDIPGVDFGPDIIGAPISRVGKQNYQCNGTGSTGQFGTLGNTPNRFSIILDLSSLY